MTIREFLEDNGFNFGKCRGINIELADGDTVEVDDDDAVLDVNFRWKGAPKSLCYPEFQAYDNKYVYTPKLEKEGGNYHRVKMSKTPVGNKMK
ncbi:hypothetical protein M0R19_07585 [Candidatus Pacearchaeota archaeon]|jgi:hypothetical protein|nr:hypothetical protein [bacterium]MCK9597022.1 hypothetical protein [Candidatus Pacearchaeota archaeon]